MIFMVIIVRYGSVDIFVLIILMFVNCVVYGIGV